MQINGMVLPRYKKQIEEAYAKGLAPFATGCPKEGSRFFLEQEDPYDNRSSFQRDRDRIIHSKAFRRLMYKTQVFVNHEGDHFRTRLTHTLEVAQFARGICKSLALNEDLAEAIALGHDLGHTPFGHAVEGFMDQELRKREAGRFYHNEQSVRVVEFIEKRSDNYPGLNLTSEVREGIFKHNKDRSGVCAHLNPGSLCSTLEGQVVYLVDTIAYICHDLQDGITSGLIENSANKNRQFGAKYEELKELIAGFLSLSPEQIDFSPYSNTYFIDELIHFFIMNITNTTVHNLEKFQVKGKQDVEELASKNCSLVGLDEKNQENFKRLRTLIYESVYGMHTIEIMDFKAVNLARDLFGAYLDAPKLLPPEWYYRYENYKNDEAYKDLKPVHVICDYISCMTDRYALDEHDRLFNPRIKI